MKIIIFALSIIVVTSFSGFAIAENETNRFEGSAFRYGLTTTI